MEVLASPGYRPALRRKKDSFRGVGYGEGRGAVMATAWQESLRDPSESNI